MTSRPTVKEPADFIQPQCSSVEGETSMPIAGFPDEVFDPESESVRIEYDEGDRVVAVWLAPDGTKTTSLDGDPVVERSAMARLMASGVAVVRDVLAVLRAIPGSRIRSCESPEDTE